MGSRRPSPASTAAADPCSSQVCPTRTSTDVHPGVHGALVRVDLYLIVARLPVPHHRSRCVPCHPRDAIIGLQPRVAATAARRRTTAIVLLRPEPREGVRLHMRCHFALTASPGTALTRRSAASSVHARESARISTLNELQRGHAWGDPDVAPDAGIRDSIAARSAPEATPSLLRTAVPLTWD